MAKVTGGLLSLGADGTIASTLTFSRWKGRPYVRQRVVPSNPRSTAQTLTRNIFSNLNAIWKSAPALLVAPWDRFAAGNVLTGRNAFVGDNIAVLRGEIDLAKMIFSPGAKGGLAQDTTQVTPAVGQVTVTVTTPTPPAGWTLQAVVAAAIKDGAPETITDFVVVAGEDTTDPITEVVLAGLDATAYAVGAWLRWAKPDATIAYGPSVTNVVTVT